MMRLVVRTPLLVARPQGEPRLVSLSCPLSLAATQLQDYREVRAFDGYAEVQFKVEREPSYRKLHSPTQHW